MLIKKYNKFIEETSKLISQNFEYVEMIVITGYKDKERKIIKENEIEFHKKEGYRLQKIIHGGVVYTRDDSVMLSCFTTSPKTKFLNETITNIPVYQNNIVMMNPMFVLDLETYKKVFNIRSGKDEVLDYCNFFIGSYPKMLLVSVYAAAGYIIKNNQIAYHLYVENEVLKIKETKVDDYINKKEKQGLINIYQDLKENMDSYDIIREMEKEIGFQNRRLLEIENDTF